MGEQDNQNILSVFATTTRDGICITASDYKRLAPGEYFNDTLVEFSLKEILASRPHLAPRTHIFCTHFYSTLRDSGYSAVKNWTKGIDIFQKEYLIIPVHEKFHWYLAIIHRPGQILPPSGTENAAEQLDGVSVAHIYILDSLSGPHEQTRLELGQYLFNEALDKNTIVPTGVQSHNSLLGWFGTHIAGYDVPVPIQNNAIDCGVYLIHFAEIFLNDPEMVASSM